jgi:hypothetical protein
MKNIIILFHPVKKLVLLSKDLFMVLFVSNKCILYSYEKKVWKITSEFSNINNFDAVFTEQKKIIIVFQKTDLKFYIVKNDLEFVLPIISTKKALNEVCFKITPYYCIIVINCEAIYRIKMTDVVLDVSKRQFESLEDINESYILKKNGLLLNFGNVLIKHVNLNNVLCKCLCEKRNIAKLINSDGFISIKFEKHLSCRES